MTLRVAISYARAKAINRDGQTLRWWSSHALERGVSASAIDHVEEQWYDGHVKLILDVEEWTEIQMKGGD